MNSFEKKLTNRFVELAGEIKKATPGFQLHVLKGAKTVAKIDWAKTYEYYDLASLTKILFTATWASHLTSQKKIKASDHVNLHWPDWHYPKMQFKDLWTHSAGLPWWQPFYKSLIEKSREQKWQHLERELLKLKIKKSKKAIYSDPDLLVTAAALKHGLGSSLLEGWQTVQSSGWTKDLHFNLDNKRTYAKASYAPTELCPWRKIMLQGLVHDENTFSLGGMAPHAGLFGRAEDVSHWAFALRRVWRGQSTKFMKTSVLHEFTKRQISKQRGDWGYLFMKPTKGHASAGKYFSLDSFGHTGFTGTSLWMDMRRDVSVILLSNRVHPTRENQNFVSLRPKIHDIVIEEIER